MVTSSVDYLGQTCPVCFARPLLYKATEALERGDITRAGVYMREALKRYLGAMCERYDCFPKRQRTPRTLLNALRHKGHVDPGMFQWYGEMIDAGNRAAHCKYVRPELIEFAIAVLHQSISYSVEGVEIVEGGVR